MDVSIQEKDHVRTQQESSHLEAEEKGHRKNHPRQYSDHGCPAFKTEVFEPLSLCYFTMAGPTNFHCLWEKYV